MFPVLSRRLNFPLPSPPLPPPIASTSPSRRLHFSLPSPPLPPPVASTSPSRRLHFSLPSPPLPPPVASTSPSRRLHFPIPSPPLPPPIAATSPSRSRRLHFPLPSPPLPPPVAATSPSRSRRLHFPLPSPPLPPPAPSTSPSRRLRFLLTLSPLSPFPLPTLPRRPSVGSKVASLLRHRDQSSFRRHPILPFAPPLSSPHFPSLPFPLRSAASSHSLASPTSHRLSVFFSPFRASVWAAPLQRSLLSRSRATVLAIQVQSGPGPSCEGCSKLSLLPSPLSILLPPLSPSRLSSPPRRVAIWRHLRVFYAHVAMSAQLISAPSGQGSSALSAHCCHDGVSIAQRPLPLTSSPPLLLLSPSRPPLTPPPSPAAGWVSSGQGGSAGGGRVDGGRTPRSRAASSAECYYSSGPCHHGGDAPIIPSPAFLSFDIKRNGSVEFKHGQRYANRRTNWDATEPGQGGTVSRQPLSPPPP
ncbi:unnamed protein product [Closterium sp. NIES-65]|nr:unnamed protein product [Closterium sp. NIES-65]